jgi:hypothetical protein
MEVKKLDKQSAAVFTKLLKEKSYAHFEARSEVVLVTVVLPVPFLPSNTERASKWA